MLSLVAQSTSVPISSTQLYPLIVIGIAVVGLNAAVGLIGGIVAIWDKTRTKPPLHDTYATQKSLDATSDGLKIELKALEERNNKRIESLDRLSESRSKENRDLIQEKISGMEKWIGERIADNKSSNSEQFGALKGEMHAVRGTMQSLSNDLFRSVGRMEGKHAVGNQAE